MRKLVHIAYGVLKSGIHSMPNCLGLGVRMGTTNACSALVRITQTGVMHIRK